MVPDEDIIDIDLSVVAEAYPANGDIDIVLFVDVSRNPVCNKSLDSGNGKQDHQDDKKQQQSEQSFTNYFPEFFDRYLCFNFANNINDF